MPTIPNHANHSHKFMIQLRAVGNKSRQVMSRGKTSPSDSQVNSWTALLTATVIEDHFSTNQLTCQLAASLDLE